MGRESTIYQMFYGFRGSQEEIRHSQEYFQLMKAFCDMEKAFSDAIQNHPELPALYEKVQDTLSQAHSEALYCHFEEGFRFGFLLALDILQK